jgi:hypothetical protein
MFGTPDKLWRLSPFPKGGLRGILKWVQKLVGLKNNNSIIID